MIPFPVNFWGSGSGITQNIDESLGMTDSITVASFVGDQTVSIDETLSITDAISVAPVTRLALKTLAELQVCTETITLFRVWATVAETLLITDSIAVNPVDRLVLKSLPEETQALAELIDLLKRKFTNIDETLLATDAISVTPVDRLVLKSLADVQELAETITMSLIRNVDETVTLIDAISVTPVSRTQTKTLSDTFTLDETIDFTAPIPVISSCTHNMGAPGSGGGTRCNSSVTFATGDNTQSVRVQFSLNSGAWSDWQNIDTSPNTGGYTASTRLTDEGDTMQWRVIPFSGNSQTGAQGTVCDSSTRTCELA